MKNSLKILFFLLMLLLGLQVNAQLLEQSASVIDIPELKVRKSGPYLGLQKGSYFLIEAGAEMQFKQVKLVRPVVNAFRMGFNYDYKNNVLGYDGAYWYQRGRLGLTFGGAISYRTNFDSGRVGFAPMIGFRLTQFHLQTGYHFHSSSTSFTEVNRFFIALKFVFISKRKRDLDR